MLQSDYSSRQSFTGITNEVVCCHTAKCDVYYVVDFALMRYYKVFTFLDIDNSA